jgi:dTDP-4-dehydrorhamnose reductase
MKVVVLGASGMLGSMVTDVLSRNPELKVVAAARDQKALEKGKHAIPEAQWESFDASSMDVSPLLTDAVWVINAIGITKPLIRDDNAFEVERALRINSQFPYLLSRAAEKQKAQVIQIATDCVYSGAKGKYQEDDLHDSLDVYGKSKSMGEARLDNMHHLRCSIIGPEIKEFRFLLEWFLRQPKEAEVNGFVNHEWNGVTTYHFAKLCLGIIQHDSQLGFMQHVVPTKTITKADLLQVFAKAYNRTDVKINRTKAGKVVDRTLGTTQSEQNVELWKAAGYATPPTVAEMIQELSQFEFRVAPKKSA